MAEKKDMVTIFVEREHEGEDFVFVGINGTNYQIRTDEEVEVPAAVAEVLANSKKLRKEARAKARAKGIK